METLTNVGDKLEGEIVSIGSCFRFGTSEYSVLGACFLRHACLKF